MKWRPTWLTRIEWTDVVIAILIAVVLLVVTSELWLWHPDPQR